MTASDKQTYRLHIGGTWVNGGGGDWIDIENPATGEPCATVARATSGDLDAALDAADRAAAGWRGTSPWVRSEILAACAREIAARREHIAMAITREQGKPLAESLLEVGRTVDAFAWCSAEAIRVYGRVLPQRESGMRQMSIKEPIGPVAAFTPWNFPAFLPARKISAALGAGCPIIIKPAEEAPGAAAIITEACAAAGVPPGVINLVSGDPAQISEHLIRSSVIRKVSLTGSPQVGRKLASLAGEMLKPATMELGGHAPVIVFADSNVRKAAEMTAAFKFRNAGQVCLGVSRIFVQEAVFDAFREHFLACVRRIRLGDGTQDGITMGPMATARGVNRIERLMSDALSRGAISEIGGDRAGEAGHFWQPTVLTGVPQDALLMNEEPFGPIAPLTPFSDLEDVLVMANSVDLGLAGYFFTRDLETATLVADQLEFSWIGINNFSPTIAEAPFGGIRNSGFGYEGGPEGFDAYCRTKFISQASL
ncbi:MAG: NAD-dependent succinate-semialdehyde dehydrogenase [Burkholderiaceae bacterium]